MMSNDQDLKKDSKVPEETPAETAEETVEDTETEAAADREPKEESTEASLEEAKEESEEDEALQTKYMRLMADFQNFKRRAEKTRTDSMAFATEQIALPLLDVMDNFERALDHDADSGFKDGMVMIFRQLQQVLEKAGVEEIDIEDADFDPNFHNAVMMEDTDAVDSGKISTVLQKGYTLNGKVIRPSMVKVAN